MGSRSDRVAKWDMGFLWFGFEFDVYYEYDFSCTGLRDVFFA